MIKQVIIAILVVRSIVNNIHFRLPVSFFIVRQVVEHGKCNSEKRIVQIAVVIVHPLSTNICFNNDRLLISVILVFDK